MPPWVKWVIIILVISWLLNINLAGDVHSIISILQQIHHATGGTGNGG